jgi:hypothetical protein
MSKRIKFLLSSIMLVLLGGSIVGTDSTFLISLAILFLLITTSCISKNSDKNENIDETNFCSPGDNFCEDFKDSYDEDMTENEYIGISTVNLKSLSKSK